MVACIWLVSYLHLPYSGLGMRLAVGWPCDHVKVQLTKLQDSSDYMRKSPVSLLQVWSKSGLVWHYFRRSYISVALFLMRILSIPQYPAYSPTPEWDNYHTGHCSGLQDVVAVYQDSMMGTRLEGEDQLIECSVIPGYCTIWCMPMWIRVTIFSLSQDNQFLIPTRAFEIAWL